MAKEISTTTEVITPVNTLFNRASVIHTELAGPRLKGRRILTSTEHSWSGREKVERDLSDVTVADAIAEWEAATGETFDDSMSVVDFIHSLIHEVADNDE